MTLLRTTQLMAGLLLRRFLNRTLAGMRRKKKGQERTGTGRKKTGSVLLMLYISVMMGFAGFSVSSNILRSVSAAMGPTRDAQGHIEVSHRTYSQLEELEERQQSVEARGRESRMIFWNDASRRNISPEQLTARSVAFQKHYRQQGIDGFVGVAEDEGGFLPELRAWHRPEIQPILSRAMSMILLLLAVWRYFLSLGSANQDLGKVEWNTEWFFTFPAQTRHLFAAQTLGHALVDPFAWIASLPFLLVLFHSTGMGWNALPAALGGMLYLSLVMAALRVSSETWLRKRFAPARLKNLQALFTLVGLGAMFTLFMLSRGGAAVFWLVDAARHGSGVWLANPFALPVALCTPLSPWLVGALAAGVGACVFAAAVNACAWMVRDGLIATTSAYVGRRGRSKASLGFLSGGIIGKDIRLLLRDRNFLVQTLVMPVLMVGFQVSMNGSLAAIGGNFQHAATFAYGLGAYVLIATALSVLSVEGNALWMLYALPVPIYRIMLRKTLLWAGCALFYTVTTLAVCAHLNHALKLVDLVYAALACAGVVIYAFIASGIGMLGTDPLETEVKRRIRPDMIQLYMLLAAMFGYAIYAPSAWTRLGQLVLSSLLAYALWQKVRDRAPYLLDPVSAPPQQVSLADGLIAALAFFVVQGLTMLIATASGLAQGPAITVAFSTAGVLVVFFTLLHFRKKPGAIFAWASFGREGLARSLGLGFVVGIGAGAFGVAYLAAMQFFPALEQLRESTPQLHIEGVWMALSAVVAAPLTEEFIFRGLVFGGMRRSLPLMVSVLGSAGIFAICHPPVSVLPVFVMGALAALGFERTGRLVTPIVTHMVYNAIALFASR